MSDVIVYKNRTNVVQVDLGSDISADTFSSEIREKALVGSTLIATWTVAFLTDGTDGMLVLTLDDSDLAAITAAVKTGYMDIKRTSGGEPYQVFSPIKVVFRETVTA